MKSEALRSFVMLSRLSRMFGIIGNRALAEREAFLFSELLSPTDDACADIADALPDADTCSESAEEIGRQGRSRGRQPDWLHFTPHLTQLKPWQFRKGDPDPFPSVPHGHYRGQKFPKLDPYLGWIYESGQKRCGRLSLSDTRALWNDDEFRDFASSALIHYAQEFPAYRWRVKDPLKLPEKRELRKRISR